MKLNPEILTNIKSINSVESKFHRDLLALLYSPSVFGSFFPQKLLFNDFHFNSFSELWQWFKCIEPLDYPLSADRLRLGKYAEELMKFYFKNSKNHKLLRANLQLIDDKVTVGEIDFLLQNTENETFIHLEQAIKYFLKVEFEGSIEWIGPSSKDNLSKKQHKLLNHQLQLTKLHQRLFPEEFNGIDFEQKLLLKGAGFIHFKDYQPTDNPFANAWWLHETNVEFLTNRNRF